MTKVINLRDRQAVAKAKADGSYVRIDRATVWGNPFVIGRDGDREAVIARHWYVVMSDPDTVARIKRELRDKTLACWCHPLPCHGDTYAKIANEEGM